MKYKIALYGDKIEKEITLDERWKQGIYIGTTNTSHLRFHKGMFPINFEICVFAVDGQWQAKCSDGICLQNSKGKSGYVYFDVLDTWHVLDLNSGLSLFELEFDIDFEKKALNFDTRICTENEHNIIVGGTGNCNIMIEDPVLEKDYFIIIEDSGNSFLYPQTARYGVLLNGKKCRQSQILLHDKDFLTINGYDFYWNKKRLYTGSNVKIRTAFKTYTKGSQSNHLTYPKFIRSPRQQFVVPEQKLNLLPPSSKPQEPKKNLVVTVMPVLVSMGMMVMLRMAIGGNIMYALLCIGMGLTGISTSIINYRQSGKDYQKELVKRENDYNKYIASQEKKIQDLQKKERVISEQQYPELEDRLREVEDFDARLFEKQKEHEDYLYIRIGTGVVESKCAVEYKEQEYRQVDDPMMDYPTLFRDKYKHIADMPIMLDLRKNSVIGFVGDRNHLYQMMKNIILQLCIEHYYQDLKTVFIINKEDTVNFEWARWFRNASDEKSGVRYFAYDEDSNKIVLEYLYALLNERSKHRKEELISQSTYVIFAYRSYVLASHPISLFVEKAQDLNCVFIFFDDYPEFVNMYCKKRIFLNSNEWTGVIQDVDDGEQVTFFEYKRIELQRAREVAEKMASVYVDEVNLESTLTKNITLYQLLGIMNVRDLNLDSRWANSHIYDSMAAPLGVKSGGEIVYLDLHEKFHGPHGLVAGTTGSGKSEIMQSYILSMATLFHPHEVGFIIIDFKGGGMVNQFRKLPHLNGAITNIDGKEIERSLLSIKAELQKRQRYFALYDVNHIDDYIRLFKKGEAKEPLPHLILIVDEFAELKSEQPDFMKELISAARIGRSLGVHLILATQKPSGVVNDQIWSNSKFKLCLKVQDKNDSNEVIKSPLAAEIREPGRAYLQVGNNEIFELFQSAYSGAPVPNGSMGAMKSFKISKVALSGRREIIFEQKQKLDEDGKNQLDAIVEYISEYCQKNQISRLPDICLPSLGTSIEYNTMEYTNASTDICVPVGIFDAPKRQAQEVMDVNFSQGHVIIIGSSQMGKTSLLTCMIRGIAEKYSSDEVQIYILDYASMILKNFEKLNHVGDVIISTEEDKAKNFCKLMVDEIQLRKDKLSELGLSSYAAYRESGKTEMNQIVIMLDNIAVFREINFNLDDQLLKIVREGSAVGICVVATAMQTSGLGYRYLSNFSKRFALYCNDYGEYSSVFDRCRQKLEQIPGRCFVEIEKEIYEGQIYIPFPAQKEIERVTKIKEFIQEANATDKGKGARRTPVMPNSIDMETLWKSVNEPWVPYVFPIGMNYENLEADIITLPDFPILGICGENRLMRIGYVNNIINELLSKKQDAPVNIYIFDDTTEEFKKFESLVTLYTTDASMVVDTVRDVCNGIKNKNGAIPYDCFIINSESACDILGEDEDLYNLCRTCLVNNTENGISFVLANIKNESLYAARSRFVRLLKDANNLVIFDEMNKIRIVDLNPTIRNKYKDMAKKPDDAWFKCGDYFALYKTPQ